MTKEHCKSCGRHRNELEEPPWATSIEGSKEWGIICKPCRQREIENKIEEFQSQNVDTTYEDDIICPHCGTKHQADGESSAFYQEGEHDFECCECGNEFQVETMITYTYSSFKK